MPKLKHVTHFFGEPAGSSAGRCWPLGCRTGLQLLRKILVMIPLHCPDTPGHSSAAPASTKMGSPVPPQPRAAGVRCCPWGPTTLTKMDHPHHGPCRCIPPAQPGWPKAAKDFCTSHWTVALGTEAAAHREEGLTLALPTARAMPSTFPHTPARCPGACSKRREGRKRACSFDTSLGIFPSSWRHSTDRLSSLPPQAPSRQAASTGELLWSPQPWFSQPSPASCQPPLVKPQATGHPEL